MRRTSKKTMVGGVLALSLILTGTGYAYWTDTLNVTTKATTGDLEVKFADLGLYAQYANETINGGWSIVDGISGSNISDDGYVGDDFFMRGKNYNIIAKDGSIAEYQKRSAGYNNVEFNAEMKDADAIKKNVGDYTTANTLGSDVIELTVTKMYPGYAQAFRTDILNVGEMAAKLSNITFALKDGDDLLSSEAAEDMLGLAIYINQEKYKPDQVGSGNNVFKLCQSLATSKDDYFTVGQVDFLRLSALKDLDPAKVKSIITNAEILCSPDTDNRMDLFLGVAMDPDKTGVYTTGSTDVMADNVDANSQNKGVTITMDLDWDQFNVGKDAGTANYLNKQNVE